MQLLFEDGDEQVNREKGSKKGSNHSLDAIGIEQVGMWQPIAWQMS